MTRCVSLEIEGCQLSQKHRHHIGACFVCVWISFHAKGETLHILHSWCVVIAVNWPRMESGESLNAKQREDRRYNIVCVVQF